MAIKFSDLALRQAIGANFPGAPGQAQIGQPPTAQTNPLFEGPTNILAQYVLDGTEAVGDIILIGVGQEGWIIGTAGKVASGIVAPAATLTLAIGDNDIGLATARPAVNPGAIAAAVGGPYSTQAPAWVSGTTYAVGNVVLDTAASSGIFVQNDSYVCMSATSGATAPHSAATTVWMPTYQRYSGSISTAAANGNVLFTGGTQLWGGPAVQLPFAVTPGAIPTGYTANELLFQKYQLQTDCWIMARVLTSGTPVAGTVLCFDVPVIASN